VLVAALTLVAGVACDGSGSSAPSPRPRRDLPAFEQLAQPRDRHNADFAVAGGDVLATGGYSFTTEFDRVVDGARLHRAGTRGWVKSDPPFSGPLSKGGAVWTGRRLIVASQMCPGRHRQDPTGDSQIVCRGNFEAAALDPASSKWQKLEPPPRRSTDLGVDIQTRGAGWTGRHAVFTFGEFFSGRVHAALFDPVNDTWQTLESVVTVEPAIEQNAPGPTVCVGQGSILRLTLTERGTPVPGWRLVTEVWSVRERRWERLAQELDFDTPEGAPFHPRFSCESETEALVVSLSREGGGTTLHRFGGADVGWQQLPALPSASPGAALLQSGDEVAVWPETYADSRYYLLEPGGTGWRTVPKPEDGYRMDVSGTHIAIGDERVIYVVDPFAYARE
jgi:hypothetical protein